MRPGGRDAVDWVEAEFGLIAAGRTSGEMAAELFIPARTADHHIQDIYTKIGLSNRAAATRWAVTHCVADGVLGG